MIHFVPDHTVETWRPDTRHGGHDAGDRSLRYLEWNHDSDPGDHLTTASMAYLLKEGDGPVRLVQDDHLLGLFPRDTWLRGLADEGFRPTTLPFRHSEVPEDNCGLFLGVVPE